MAGTMKLTDHFTLEEFVVSQEASRRGIDNTPPPEVVTALLELATALEVVRERLGVQINITSGYRCPELNAAVGGAKGSAHMGGYAADIMAPGFGNPLSVCRAIASMGLNYDQIIHEYGTPNGGGWCHFAVGPGLRRQQLTIDRTGTRQGLLP